MTEKPFTVMDLAARWGCDEAYVYEMIESNKLRAFTIGTTRRRGSYRITREAEHDFLYPTCTEEIVELETVLKGFVYFVGHGHFLKIGFTSLKDWRRRVTAIQTHNPERISIWRVFAADAMKEGELHEALKEYRVSGEWFKLGAAGKAKALTIMSGFAPVFVGSEPDVA